jgi:hypothetical protein
MFVQKKDILILLRKEDRSLMLQSSGYLHGCRNALCTLCQKEKKNSKQKNHQNSSEYDCQIVLHIRNIYIIRFMPKKLSFSSFSYKKAGYLWKRNKVYRAKG